ncbi:hypothetical protein Q3G72_004722 [Acer saccharum]|nr:hypothetical protein Q3G72_004722 [Acer saccharum]
MQLNLQVSMAILGKNKVLPLLKTEKISWRHRLLKCIARLIPRYERCTCNECEVISGIFGNAFWHQNVSPTMHSWLNMQSSTRLPMSTFPHLRKICKAGFIVDSNGKNSYLIHPERMEVSTLYISGGRNILVTPETSFLANKYMKLHQPGLRHERVVVDGFGHSDLLIGEESYKKVFPHILSHIRLAEQGENLVMNSGKKCNEEALAWADDPYGEDRGFGSISVRTCDGVGELGPSWSFLVICMDRKSNLFWGFMDSGDMSGYFGYFNSSRNRWTSLSGLGIWFLILSLDRLDREFLADWRSSS